MIAAKKKIMIGKRSFGKDKKRAWVEIVAPYLLSIAVWIVSTVLMYLGDRYLLQFGFPWALVSLLVIAATAIIWGSKPGALVLALSSAFGDVMIPDMHISYFDQSDLAVHVRLARLLLFLLCGSAIIFLTHQAKTMRITAERRREVVSALQRMILPEKLAVAPGYDVHGIYDPAQDEEAVGGDFYDFFTIGDGIYVIVIGDVMGKGKDAASYTALLRYSVRALSDCEASPGQILCRVNDMIEIQKLQFGTATLFVAMLDVATGRLRYASAGHEPPMLARADGRNETLAVTGTLIGVGADMDYDDAVETINAGDTLLLMTDGVSEARNSEGEFLTSEGAWPIVRHALKHQSVSVALSHIESTVMSYIGKNSRDDIALLMLRRTTPQTSANPVPQNATDSVSV